VVEDEGKKEEFDFTAEGEALGYISLDQARVLAMRTAREAPGAYGLLYQDVPMAFEVSEEEDTEDHYVITLSFRPEGAFTGTPGREQFFIEKEGNLAVRQVLSLPGPSGWRRYRLALVAIGLVVVVAAAVGGVFVATGGGGSDDTAPLAAASPTSTPESPSLTPTLAPTTAPVAIPPVVPTATPTPASAPTTVQVLVPTPTPLSAATPTPTPEPQQPRLVHWWPGDGNANDVVGDSGGTLLGGATYAPGQVGLAFSLPQSGAHIAILSGNDDINFAPTEPMTVVMWAKRTSPPGPLPPGRGIHLLGKRPPCGPHVAPMKTFITRFIMALFLGGSP